MKNQDIRTKLDDAALEKLAGEMLAGPEPSAAVENSIFDEARRLSSGKVIRFPVKALRWAAAAAALAVLVLVPLLIHLQTDERSTPSIEHIDALVALTHAGEEAYISEDSGTMDEEAAVRALAERLLQMEGFSDEEDSTWSEEESLQLPATTLQLHSTRALHV